MTTIEKMDKHANDTQEIVKQVIDLWQNEVVFSWRWWFGVLTTWGSTSEAVTTRNKE